MENIDLNALELFDDNETPIDTDNLPEERSSIPKEIPVPGVTLKLQIPLVDNSNAKDVIKALQTDAGQRIALEFKDSNAFRLANGSQQEVTINGYDRAIYDKGQVVGTTNEVAKFLKAAGFKGTLSSKADYVKAIQAVGGNWVLADNSPFVKCNPKKEVFKAGKKLQGVFGCDTRYALKAQSYDKKDGTHVEILSIPRDPATGAFKSRFECKCGNLLTAWPQFTYRAVGK